MIEIQDAWLSLVCLMAYKLFMIYLMLKFVSFVNVGL